MKSFFYSRSVYPIIGRPIPKYFLALDNWFESQFTDPDDIIQPWQAPAVHMAENLCRHLGDVEMYAMLVRDATELPNPNHAAIMTGTYLVGYFSACKSVLDACSVTINELYNLDLPYKVQDFTKTKFWRTLATVDAAAESNYRSFEPTFREVITWRDAAVHRTTPFAFPVCKGDIDTVPRSEIEIKISIEAGYSLRRVMEERRMIDMIEPDELHDRWAAIFHTLLQRVCEDIEHRSVL
ncbi:MAG: hypothetical protein KDI79_24760 [Anaerolineae bacterium]|nr:hypothetical protein [Anaerolineae bacterium]